jgi:molybdopterin synthase catalytic subunit
MANCVSQVLLTKNRLKNADDTPLSGASKTDVDLESGAVVDFWGVVRELEDGRAIEGIDYEAHQAMAEHQMKLIADGAIAKFQLKRVVLHHRTGFVGAGEPSLFLRVSARHRGAAFEASTWIVDELKKKVPIWKKPAFAKATARQAKSTVSIRQ